MTLSWGEAMSPWGLKVDGTKTKGVGQGRAGLERAWNQMGREPDQELQALPWPRQALSLLFLLCLGQKFCPSRWEQTPALPSPEGGMPAAHSYQKMKPREQNHQEGGWGPESQSVHNSVNLAVIRGNWNLIQASPLCS